MTLNTAAFDKVVANQVAMEEIFAAQSDNIGISENVKDGKTGELPKHPGEKPSKVIHVKWAKAWRNGLLTAGYGAQRSA